MEIDLLVWRHSVCGAAMNDLACPAEAGIVASILHEGVPTPSDFPLNVKSGLPGGGNPLYTLSKSFRSSTVVPSVFVLDSRLWAPAPVSSVSDVGIDDHPSEATLSYWDCGLCSLSGGFG